MFARILVATDGSKLSARAVAKAAELAQLSSARLLLLHVQQPYVAPRGAYPGLGIAKHFRDAQRAAGAQVLDAAIAAAARKKVVAEGRVVEHYSPFEAIIKAAKKDRCDLIVMASHGRRGLKALLVGSETQKVLTHSSVPVLVVR